MWPEVLVVAAYSANALHKLFIFVRHINMGPSLCVRSRFLGSLHRAMIGHQPPVPPASPPPAEQPQPLEEREKQVAGTEGGIALSLNTQIHNRVVNIVSQSTNETPTIRTVKMMLPLCSI